ncbi:helix-turn-helix domain-containing protein [Kocuria palustris]|uniref:helix-turn-helix domain-containing protein n=1 Tax=Kocuria palustris TaxID=71999 RepID=UPI00077B7A8A
MTTQKQLALSIRSRMALRDMTQAGLADAIGMGHSALSARMNGTREFTFADLEAMAGALGVPLRDLLPADAQEGGRP